MYRRILVPLDGSPTSERGLEEAIRLARWARAELRLVHVVDSAAAASGVGEMTDVVPAIRLTGASILARSKSRAAEQGVDADTVLVEGLTGRAADVVVDQARSWGADLIVMGTYGRRGLARALQGSDADRVLRSAPVPVLLLRLRDATEKYTSS